MTASSGASPTRVAFYASALQAFATSSASFRVLHSISASAGNPPTPPPPPPPKNLYVLDSSFNPPTLAHLRIARSALLEDTHPDAKDGSKRLLLLLATQNADKAPKPAAFEQRLVMMEIFARELLTTLNTKANVTTTQEDGSVRSSHEDERHGERGDQGKDSGIQGVDIALTTHPYFVQKAAAISADAAFPAATTTQIHLTGFDTLIRILDSKYYPPSYTLHTLQPFLDSHRLRVAYRVDDSWGSREEQDSYLESIRVGGREEEGARKEWVERGRIALVEGRERGEEVISSTKVRQAVKDKNNELLSKLVNEGIAAWILKERIYLVD